MNLLPFNQDAIRGWALETKANKDEDDDLDLFGDVDEEEEAEMKEKQKLASEEAKKKKKKEVIAKSIVTFDVKSFDEEQDFNVLASKILSLSLDGLVWFEKYEILPVAYTIKKLRISCIIEDEKVSTDDITDKIEAFEDEVQNVDIVSFQKN